MHTCILSSKSAKHWTISYQVPLNTVIECVNSDSSRAIHAGPETLNQWLRHAEEYVEWSTLSKAAAKSERTIALTLPLCIYSENDFFMKSKKCRYCWMKRCADWNGEISELEDIWACIRFVPIYSRIFLYKFKVHLGLWLDRLPGSRECFFSRGWTMVCAKAYVKDLPWEIDNGCNDWTLNIKSTLSEKMLEWCQGENFC